MGKQDTQAMDEYFTEALKQICTLALNLTSMHRHFFDEKKVFALSPCVD